MLIPIGTRPPLVPKGGSRSYAKYDNFEFRVFMFDPSPGTKGITGRPHVAALFQRRSRQKKAPTRGRPCSYNAKLFPAGHGVDRSDFAWPRDDRLRPGLSTYAARR